MKTKFKDLLLYTLACVGAVSLLLSALDKPKENSQNDWIYNAVASEAGIVVYNTYNGSIKFTHLK